MAVTEKGKVKTKELFPEEEDRLIDLVTMIEKFYHVESQGTVVNRPREYLGSRRVHLLFSRGLSVGLGSMLATAFPLLLSLLAHYRVIPVFGTSPSTGFMRVFDQVYIWVFPFIYALGYGWIIFRAGLLRAGRLTDLAVDTLTAGYRLGISIVAVSVILLSGFLLAKVDPETVGLLIVEFVKKLGLENLLYTGAGSRILTLVEKLDRIVTRLMVTVFFLWLFMFLMTYVSRIAGRIKRRKAERIRKKWKVSVE